jgi:hypothetical protein
MSFFDIVCNDNYLQFKLKMIILKILSFLIMGPFFKFKPGLQLVGAGLAPIGSLVDGACYVNDNVCCVPTCVRNNQGQFLCMLT